MAVVNRQFARRYSAGQDPIGRRIRRGSDGHLLEIVGLVADGKFGDVDEEPVALVYLPLAQHDVPFVTVIARSGGARDTVVRALEALEPRLVSNGEMTLQDALRVSMMLPLAIVWTTLGFALLDLMQARVGIVTDWDPRRLPKVVRHQHRQQTVSVHSTIESCPQRQVLSAFAARSVSQ